jgi:5-methylcytosine-specific restriction endonuclease McrA
MSAVMHDLAEARRAYQLAYRAKNKQAMADRYREKRATYYAENKEKILEKRALHKAQNKEAILEMVAQSRLRRKETIRKSSADYYQRNKAEIDAKNRAYFKSNPAATRSYQQNRRARVANATGSLSTDLLEKLRALQKNKCANCSANCTETGELDHIVPLFLGGSNTDENIQLLCKGCNRKNHTKDPLVWANQNGRLL